MKKILLFILLVAGGIAGCSQQDQDIWAPPRDDVERLLQLDERYTNGDFGYVLTEGRKYVAEYPKSYKGWSLLGWAYLQTDDLNSAERCIDRSLAINPRWDNAYVAKGVLYRKQGDLDAASNSYKRAIELLPDNPEAFASLLVIELMRGNDQKAVEYGEKAWALRTDNPTIPANLSVAYHYTGDYEKRDEFYKHAERLGYRKLSVLKEFYEGKRSIR